MHRFFASLNRQELSNMWLNNRSSFRFWDNVVGWMVFAIATLSYWATMEPTTSLWDCSEFIATSYKLEVGHPPGAPLYMMLARIASLFAPSPEDVPLMINGMNSLFSGFTILFMFWTITHLARRIVTRNGEMLSGDNIVLVLGAGAVGALSYAYTDTFWFSAVEGEVYALSSMFTALVVWLMFKWEENADSPTSMRWIILIAYLMGLSIGVHILNLLTIPALVMIYFFRRYKYDASKPKWRYPLMIVAALAISMVILGVINGIIIPYTVLLGAYVDTFAVNVLGLPVNVGMVIFVFAIFGLLGWLIYFSHKRRWRVTNVAALCCTVILLGFSSYAMMTIRANANPPMNSNNPSNPHMLLSVLNRDQYGNRPLIKGTYYDAKPLPTVDELGNDSFQRSCGNRRYLEQYKPTGNIKENTTMWYNPETERYEERVSDWEYIYPESAYHYFPRMWFFARADEYKQYVEYPTPCDDDEAGEWTEPSKGDDFGYFMSYQMGDMFWRYFMWNFVGRQDDVQLQKSEADGGTYLHGGWLSGIGFIDKIFCGPQDNLPSDMANNPARNTYFFLPLLLGLLGLIYHLLSDTRNWFVVLLMFILMGVALVVYFNTAPNEPRERDYVYAGAFYAFSIWIGLGVMAVGALFKEVGGFVAKSWKLGTQSTAKYVSVSLAILFSAVVPMVLAAENWDDHDRSERYFARDIGWNYLNTVPENAILINYGDNDTFPLWYCQEVEGVRPDVKVMNSSYLEGEWYIDQMKLASNGADGVPFTIPTKKYTMMDGSAFVSYNPVEYIDDGDFLKLSNEVNAILTNEGGRGVYRLPYDSVAADGSTTPRIMEITFTEVADEYERLYDEYETLYYGDDAEANSHKITTVANKIRVLSDITDEYSEHQYAKDYALYREYYNQVNMYAPTRLPLADVIAHYISDEPMWLIMCEADYDTYWRIVKPCEDINSEYPGYEKCAVLYPVIDSPLTGEPTDYIIYADAYTIPVDVDAALKAGIITQADIDAGRVLDEVTIKISSSVISRGQLMMYDLFGNYDWGRAICFTQTHLAGDYGLKDYLRFDGYSYTFVPIYTSYEDTYPYVGCMDIDKLYPLFMDECENGALNKALRFGNLADEDVLADYFVRFNVQASGAMRSFARVASGFAERAEGDDLKKSEALLDRGLAVLPPDKLGYEASNILEYVKCYYLLGDMHKANGEDSAAKRCYNKANELNTRFVVNRTEWLDYYTDYVDNDDLTVDIAHEIAYEYRTICHALTISTQNGREFYDVVVDGCGKDNPEVVVARLMRSINEQMPPSMKESLFDAVDKCNADGSKLTDHFGGKKLAIVILIEEIAYNYMDGIDVFRNNSFIEARNALLKRSGVNEIYGFKLPEEKQMEGSPKQGGVLEQLSEDVLEVLSIYEKGLDAWVRSTEYVKKAVDSLAPKLGVEVNVEEQDIFQYFYAYSDYAEQMCGMAMSRGIDLTEEGKLLSLSDEQYALADEYLRHGDTAAVKLIAECSARIEPSMERIESGSYSIDDVQSVYVGMIDIIDVIDVVQQMAGSFEWIVADIGYDYGIEQVSFDTLMSRFVTMANGCVFDDTANNYFADVAIRAYSLLPHTRSGRYNDVNAEYLDALTDYLEHPSIMPIWDEKYNKK